MKKVRSNTVSALFPLTSLFLWLIFAVPAHAVPIPIPETIVTVPLTELNLAGQGSLPLGFDAGNPPDNYGFVASDVSVSLAAPSTLTITQSGTIDFDTQIAEIDVDLEFDLFLQFMFTDVDPGADYTSLGNMFTISPADSLNTAISGHVTLDLNIADLSDPNATIPVTATITSNTIKHNLGVDINNNGPLDFIAFSIDDFLLDENDLLFEPVDPNDISQGLIVTTASLTLSGQVADVDTDPPFTIDLMTVPTLIPEPPIALLFTVGLISLIVRKNAKLFRN